MSEGSATDRPVIWPGRLDRACDGRLLIYLDLNHWIMLARSSRALSTPPGYAELLAACRRGLGSGLAAFPLSDVHYMEMSGIKDPKQRGDVAAVMGELSQYKVMLSRTTIIRLEMEAVLDALQGVTSRGTPIPFIGTSAGWAFGVRGGLRLSDQQTGEDLTDTVRHQAWFQAANREMERRLLAGPSDTEAAHLREYAGYRPESARLTAEKRAEQEREQADRLTADPRWRRGRLRDVVAARELALEWIDALTEVTTARGTTIGIVVDQDRELIRQFSESLPSNRVAISLKFRYHRDGNKQWTPNDIHDIDALAAAVPYCHAVLTDKAARSALVAERLGQVMSTYLPRTPGELADWLHRGGVP